MNVLDRFFGDSASQKDTAVAPYVAPLEKGDYEAAVPLLKAAIEKEDATAMGLFATLFTFGRGVEKNQDDACAWFRQAANRGHVRSQAALGMCLINGLGAPVDHKEAAYWLYRAASAGNSQALEVLGNLALKDSSVVGVHFTEDELSNLVLKSRKLAVQASANVH